MRTTQPWLSLGAHAWLRAELLQPLEGSSGARQLVDPWRRVELGLGGGGFWRVVVLGPKLVSQIPARCKFLKRKTVSGKNE